MMMMMMMMKTMITIVVTLGAKRRWEDNAKIDLKVTG